MTQRGKNTEDAFFIKNHPKNHPKRGLFNLKASFIICFAMGKRKLSIGSDAFLALIILLIFVLSLFPINLHASSGAGARYDKIIKTISAKYGIETSLIHSIIRTESDYNPYAISSKGAMGLMQLMPDTAIEYGVKNIFDPYENIEGGVLYLKDLMKLYYRKTKLVLAAYNAGQTAVSKYRGIPPYPETRRFIEKVMSNYQNHTISSNRKIYKFRDDAGRVVITNNPFLASSKGEDIN